jgi:predicted MPP superfamily phosphohydrolase
MMSSRVLATTAATGAVGLGCLAYAGLYEVEAFRLRRFEVPILPAGAGPIRVLHVSDLHLTPRDTKRQAWVAGLADLRPDLVVDTGDNLAHVDAVPAVLRSFERLLDVPGVFVWGSNDFFSPRLKNPFSYLVGPSRGNAKRAVDLPWQDLESGFTRAGWLDLTDVRTSVVVEGVRLAFRGTGDAHINADHYASVAGPVDREQADVTIGVTHAPYRRVIDAMAYDGLDLILAGHTHGGQVAVPGYGALVSNCDLDPRRAKGLSRHSVGGRTAWLHVSAGVGTSPYARVRFACPPEATLLTLVAGP